jgi:RNA polymerase sigma-70 factor (ECF subfamily)
VHQRIFNEALIVRIGRNDAYALQQLYESTERAVYAYILSIIRNPADTVDLVQEAYLYVRRSAHLYAPTGKPLAWLLNIARNLTNDYFRVHNDPNQKKENEVEELSLGCVSEITDRIILKHALELLRSEERQVLFLHAVAGLRHREISAYLSISISSVFTRYKRSVKKLRKHLSVLGVSL